MRRLYWLKQWTHLRQLRSNGPLAPYSPLIMAFFVADQTTALYDTVVFFLSFLLSFFLSFFLSYHPLFFNSSNYIQLSLLDARALLDF